MKKEYQILIVLVLMFSCSKQSQLLGTYKSVDPNKLEKKCRYYVQGYNSYIIGTELLLKKDSTFNLTTCSNIANGRWYCLKDSLYLLYETNRWRSDSLQKYGYEGKWPEMPQKPIALKISNKKLLWQTDDTIKGKVYRTLNILKMNNMP